jgi:hypothetical protein
VLDSVKTFKEFLKCLTLAFLCSLLLGGTVAIWRLPMIVDRQADKTRDALTAQISSAIADANGRIADTIADLNRHTRAAMGQVHFAAANADRRTGEALEIISSAAAQADRQLAGARSDLNGQLTMLNSTASALAKPLAGSAQQVDDALPLWLDCEYNPDCAFNRYQGVAKAVEQAAIAISDETPRITGHSEAVAGSFQRIAAATDKWIEKLTAPQSVKDQIKEWLQVLILAAARIL